MAAADRWGGVVSLIESNSYGFGSGLVDPETGIGYQNRGASFSLDPAHVNVLAPRKRTMHTLTPGMLFRDGRPWVVHGSMGGEIQPQIFAQVVSALVDGGLDVATAVAAPRWAAEMPEHHTPPSLSVIESRYHPQVVEGLRSRGHEVLQRGGLRSGAGAHAMPSSCCAMTMATCRRPSPRPRIPEARARRPSGDPAVRGLTRDILRHGRSRRAHDLRGWPSPNLPIVPIVHGPRSLDP